MSSYILNVPQLDYLTITTKSYELYLQYKELCRQRARENRFPTKPFTLLDYEGMVSPDGTISCGARETVNGGEYIVQLSGVDTERTFRSVATSDDYNTTRVDIAYMSSAVEYPKPQELLPILAECGVPCEVRSDERSMQTLYIGERNRTRFVRIYEKELAGRSYIRFELEIKKRLATRVAIPAVNNVSVRYGLLAGSFEKLPLQVQSQLAMEFGDSRVELPKAELQESNPMTYKDWFKETVVPSLLKRMRMSERMALGPEEYALEYKEILELLQTELDVYIEEVKGIEKSRRSEVETTRANGKRIAASKARRAKKVQAEELEAGYSDADVWRVPQGYE